MPFRSRTRFRSRAQRRRVRSRALVLAVILSLACIIGAGTAFGTRSDTAPATVIIVATATANESRPALTATDEQILRKAASSTNGTAVVVDPTTNQPTRLQLTPRRDDGQVEHDPARRQILLDNNISSIKGVLANEVNRKSSFDLLDTIAAAIRVVPPPATLIVISSGLSTAGGLDLRQVKWKANPVAIAAQLKARDLLPALQGYKMVFSGLGIDTAGPQVAPWLPEDRVLVRYWLAICHAADAASCQADSLAAPAATPRSTTPVPVVPVGQVQSVRGPDGKITFRLPYSLLFAFGSAALLPDADDTLQPIVEKATGQNMRVSITGSGSPDGGTARYNLRLSSRRASAVFHRLLYLGLPGFLVTSVRGLGFAGHSRRDCLRDGHLDEAVCVLLRNVTIVLSPARPATA
jgi:outer membrane protein OmpA-like peptidoglycan-associated protein